MRAQLVRIATVAIAGLALSACQDDGRSLLAPEPNKAYVVWNPSPQPKIVLPNPDDFVEIAAGDYHTCARKYNGNVYCWGADSLDLSLVVFRPTLAVTFPAKQVVTGASHSCALRDSDGAVYCWGKDFRGQLGTYAGHFPAWSSGWVTTPTNESQPASFITLGAGGNSTCGLTATSLYCWGVMGSIMGDSAFGGIPGVNAPNKIANWNGSGPSLALGATQACIRLTSTNGVYCWGRNDKGQAGVDPTQAMYYWNTQQLVFAQNTGWQSGALRISAHGDFTCADKITGNVECFGDNSSGQLGLANTLSFDFSPHSIGMGQPLQGVSAGVQHACALDPSGNAYCWGDNHSGQLGAGDPYAPNSTVPLSSIKPLQVAFKYTAPVTFRAIAAGKYHTCAIGKDNHIYCWGQRDWGQIGVGPYVTPNSQSSWPSMALDPQ